MMTLLGYLRTCLVVGIMLAIPAYAVYSLTAGRAAAQVNVALADEDDPIHNGLRIVDRPVKTHPQLDSVKIGADADMVFLPDYVFTNKGKPSPYN